MSPTPIHTPHPSDTQFDLTPTPILIATSQSLHLEQLEGQVAQLQVTCHSTPSGTAALAYLKQRPYRLLIVDEQLSDMSGVALCQQVRSLPEANHTAILLLLQQASHEEQLQAYFHGADDILELPLHGGLLMVKVSGWLQQWQRGQQARHTQPATPQPPSAQPVTPQPSTTQPPSTPHSLSAALHPKELKPGAMLANRYRVLELIGQGGMGKVYRALDTHLTNDVALKAFVPSEARFFGLGERFRREVMAMARFQHPNIVSVFDYYASKTLQFCTMDFLPGGTLLQKVQQAPNKRIPPVEALQTIAALADALHFMHQEQIIHRDLKPGNVMFGQAGQPIIIDFGSSLDEAIEAERLTPHGMLLGTPYYMSPEQIEKPKSVDHRCDIYALGAVLFEMLTGTLPFASMPAHQAMLGILRDGLGSPKDFLPSLPDEVEALCLQAIHPKPEQRYPTAHALKEACQRTIASVVLQQT